MMNENEMRRDGANNNEKIAQYYSKRYSNFDITNKTTLDIEEKNFFSLTSGN